MPKFNRHIFHRVTLKAKEPTIQRKYMPSTVIIKFIRHFFTPFQQVFAEI